MVACVLVTALPAAVLAQQAASAPDVWAPVRFMAGEWTGIAEGEPGKGSSTRTYTFAIKDRYLYERNVSTYPPQDANKTGEVHEHWSLISYDKSRKAIVLRQFHQEGFVNQYVRDASLGPLVFVSESFENFPNTWKARESYDIVSSDEFVETFELAEPGKAFTVYSKTRFKRRQATADPAAALAPLNFLLGTWEALDDSEGSTGKATFEAQLGNRMMLRKSYANTPASARGPASYHEDLMVISAAQPGGIRADYYDNEGHVIRYDVSAPTPGTAIFLSDIVAGQPRYRLTYTAVPNGNVKGEFAIAPPGSPDGFKTYLSWETKRGK
jgi:hypothetical protein